MDTTKSSKVFGAFPIKVRAPIERAKPKIKSESVSMRDFGVDRSFSFSHRLNLRVAGIFGSLH